MNKAELANLQPESYPELAHKIVEYVEPDNVVGFFFFWEGKREIEIEIELEIELEMEKWKWKIWRKESQIRLIIAIW